MDDQSGGSERGHLINWLQSDELASYEYGKISARSSLLEPEKRLLFAVLEDAIVCYQRFLNAANQKQRQLHQAAAAWIFAADDEGVFAFEFVCVVCRIDPEYLRSGLKKWAERNQSHASQNTMARTPRRGVPAAQFARMATRRAESIKERSTH